MDRARSFYQRYIGGLDCRDHIRIAILDTGVDERNSFIKGVRWQRHAKDSPIIESKTFVPGPKEDKCGHGTNVAGLVLKIFPQADLYIAKIAQGFEEDSIEHIVEVLIWSGERAAHRIEC